MLVSRMLFPSFMHTAGFDFSYLLVCLVRSRGLGAGSVLCLKVNLAYQTPLGRVVSKWRGMLIFLLFQVL